MSGGGTIFQGKKKRTGKGGESRVHLLEWETAHLIRGTGKKRRL